MAVSNLVGKGAKKSVRIRKWLRITALFMAVWVVCAAAVAEGAALPEESASVQAEASDGQPAQVPRRERRRRANVRRNRPEERGSREAFLRRGRTVSPRRLRATCQARRER